MNIPRRTEKGPLWSEGCVLAWKAMEREGLTLTELQQRLRSPRDHGAVYRGTVHKVLYGDQPISDTLKEQIQRLLRVPGEAWGRPERVAAGEEPFLLPGARRASCTPPKGAPKAPPNGAPEVPPHHQPRPGEVEVLVNACPDDCTHPEHGHDALDEAPPATLRSSTPSLPPPSSGPLSALVDDLGRRKLPDGRSWLSVAADAAELEVVTLDAVLGGARAAKAAGVRSPKERERATAARYRVWWTLYQAPGVDFRAIAKAWGVNPTSVSDGVRLHQERLRKGREAKGPGLAKTCPGAVRKTG